MVRRGGLAALLLLLLSAIASVTAAAQDLHDGPPDRLPPGASFGTAGVNFAGGGVQLPTSGLSLAPGFGVAAAGRAVPLPGSAGVSAATVRAPAATAGPLREAGAEEPGPPDRLPAGASFAAGTVSLATGGLSLAPGFGVGRGAAGTAPPAAGIAAATAPTSRVTVAVTDSPLGAGEGPPPVLPLGARLGTGTTVAFSTSGVSFGTASATAGLASTDLGGFAVQEEAGGYRFTLGADVLFDFDKADLRPEAGPILGELVAQVREQVPRARYQVEGHTDAKGSDAYNDRLSDRRARSVRDWLVRSGGVPSGRIGTLGFGERQPVAPNEHPDGSDDPEGRQRNRRVEILVTPLP